MPKLISNLKVDARLLWRDWRGGQLNLVVSALVLAVTVVTAVSILADRVERGLSDQITAFLAADLAVQSGIALPDSVREQATQYGLTTSTLTEFNSMVFAGNNNHLASVKVVDQFYPLRGVMQISSDAAAEKVVTVNTGPDQGTAWVEARLLNLLNVSLGDTIEVGYSQLIISHLIVNEPDRGMGFTSAGARIIMNQADLAKSRLIRPGSRAQHKLLLSGEPNSLVQYQQWFSDWRENQTDATHYRLRTPEDSEEQLGEAITRGRSFLLLSGTIGVLLAGLAMALASHRYASRLSDQVALMKAWGQSSQRIRQSQFIRLSLIAITSTLIGVLIGWLAHTFLLGVAASLFETQLPSPGIKPFIVAALTGMVCVLGFALPALWHLPSIAPLKVLRKDIPDSLLGQGQRLILGIAALMLLSLWYSGSLLIASLFLLGLALLFGVCAFIAFQLLKVIQQFAAWRGSIIRVGLSNLWRQRQQTLVQLVGFSTTLMLLIVVTGMRTNLIAEWQAQLPADTPSHFIFNVSTTELPQVKSILAQESITTTQWYPMVRGRLLKLNGQDIAPEILRRSSGLSREVNLTQASELPTDNRIIRGQWWDEGTTQAEFSIEQEVADELGLKINDELTFSVGGLTFAARLSSVRTVNWESMNPNFYIIFSPKVLDSYAPNWMAGARATNVVDDVSFQQGALRDQSPFVAKMIKQVPTAVVLELSNVVARIRNVINRVTQGLEMILLLVLACGALVLFAAIGISFDERLRENAVLRALGSSRKRVLGALAIEYATLGAIAGLIASIGAEVILYFVQTQLFELNAVFHPELWLLGIGVGTVFITVLGLLRSREIVSVPPLQSLRQV